MTCEQRIAPGPDAGRRRLNVALSLVGLVLLGVASALAVGEGYLRWRPRPLWQTTVTFGSFKWLHYDPFLGWQNLPQYTGLGFRINDQHFRGPEVSIAKRPGVLRVVCLGDSRTFGIWQDVARFRFDNAYPSVLESLLRNHGIAVEVVNAGVVGYTSAHGLRQLITRVLQLEPDIVVVAFGFNDHSLSWNTALRCHEPHNALTRDLLYGLSDLRMLEFGMSVYQGITTWQPPPLTVPWVEPDEYVYNLRRFVQVSAAYGVHLIFLNLPLRAIELGDSVPAFPSSGPTPANPYEIYGARDLAGLHRVDQSYRAIMAGVAAGTSTPVADAVSAFAANRGVPLFGRYDLVHWNAAGAQVVATTVYEKVMQLQWLTHPAS